MSRNKFDPNEIVMHSDYAEIILYDKHNCEKARTKIDLDCIDSVSGAKWYLRPNGYVATNNYHGKGYMYLHRIMYENCEVGMYVDHIDGDRLNNRRNNLRIVTPDQSGMNKRIRTDNQSGRTGVHWSKSNQKWCVMICYNKKHVNLGYFQEYDDAVKRREEAENEFFGEFTPDHERSSRQTVKQRNPTSRRSCVHPGYTAQERI